MVEERIRAREQGQTPLWVLSQLIVSIVTVYSLTCVFSYEVTSTKFSRNLFKELLISLWSAVFLGFGVLFLMLWVGIYV